MPKRSAPKKTDASKGRPPEAKNRTYDVVEAQATACKRCGSTDRTAYGPNPEVHRQPFDEVTIVTTFKRCMCTACGQWRKDKFVSKEPGISE